MSNSVTKSNVKFSKNKEFIQDFSQYIKIITKNTWVNLIPDTSKESVARVVPWDNWIRFNPIFSCKNLEKLYDWVNPAFWFTFNIKHLSFLILHELNHIINHYQLKKSKKTILFNEENLSPINYYKAALTKYGIELKFFIDIIEDIDANNHIIILQAPILEVAKKEIYWNVNIRHINFKGLPLHAQFLLCIFRESMIDDEICEVDETVREIVEHINRPWTWFSKIKDPSYSYDEQLPEIVSLYRDYYLRLKERDKIKKEQNESLEEKSDYKWNNKAENPLWLEEDIKLPHIIEDSLNIENDNKKKNWDKALKDNNWKEFEDERSNEEIKMSKQVLDKIEKSIEKKFIDDQKTPEELNLENSIKEERWDEKKFDMEEIKRQIKQQENIKNKIKLIKDRNWNSLYERITSEIFNKIIEKKKFRTIHEDSPRPLSEWWQFSPYHFVEWILQAKAWDYDPLLMQQDRPKIKEKKKTWSFSVTFILDGSSSMYWIKNTQQTLSALLMLYAVQDIRNRLEWEDIWIIDGFSIDSQVLMFKWYGKVDTIKERWWTLTRKDMIRITQELKFSSWNSNWTDALIKYKNSISKPFNWMTSHEYEERKNNVKEWKKKELVFVLSDWEFNVWWDPSSIINSLRNMWIIVCWIGISNSSSAIVRLFWSKKNNSKKDKYWFWILCPNEKDLCCVLNDLLAAHLENWIWD